MTSARLRWQMRHDSLLLLFTSGEKQADIMVKNALLLLIFLSTISVLKCLQILLQHSGKFTGCGRPMKAECICLVSLLARCVNLNCYCSRIMACVQHIVIKRKKIHTLTRPPGRRWLIGRARFVEHTQVRATT